MESEQNLQLKHQYATVEELQQAINGTLKSKPVKISITQEDQPIMHNMANHWY